MSKDFTSRTPADIHADIDRLEAEYTDWVRYNGDPDEAPEITEEMLAKAVLRVDGEIIDLTRQQRVTLYVDRDVVAAFQKRAGERGYRTLMNYALRRFLEPAALPLEETVRQIIREELQLLMSVPEWAERQSDVQK
jgi:uncharacterized protein (DUF4415 family)